MKIKRGDKVKVILGKDRGRTGVVKKVWPRKGKLILEGLNLIKKHIKPRGKDQPGGIVEKEAPLWASKVMLICPHCSQTTRVGYQIDKKGSKYRACKKCGSLIDKPGKGK